MPGPMKRNLPMAVAALIVGCSHSAPATSPPEAEGFTLRIEAVESEASSDHSLPVAHHLRNDTQATVCVGGTHTFTIDEEVAQAFIVRHALCRQPLISVGPGQVATWTMAWSGAGCWPDAPAQILEAKPRLKCGAQVALRSQIWLFRLEDGVPRFGGTEVTSQPLNLRVTEGRWEPADGI